MNNRINYTTELSTQNSTVNMELTLISFIEDNVYFVYCPALDLTGYGDNEKEAKNSFSQTLKMYIDYTTDKKTFIQDLEGHGWMVKNRKNLKSPDFDFLLQYNKQFKSIVNKRNFSKFKEEIQLSESVYS